MALLNRAQFLSRKEKSRPVKDYPIKAWEGETVRIRGLSAKDREKVERRFSKDASEAENLPSIRPWLVSLSLVDETNERLFAEGDIGQLEEMGQDVIVELFEEIMDFNGISKKAQEEVQKNSELTANGVSHSSSPVPS